MESKRLNKTLTYLKVEFFTAGAEWVKTRDSELLTELHALVGAINEIEVFMYGERITTLLDIA